MHIAYIHQHFTTPRGTSGTRSYEMSRRLLQAGHRVTMVCGAYAYEPGAEGVPVHNGVQEYDVDGIHVLRVAEPYGNEMSFRRRIVSFGRFARAATRVVSRLHADLVLASSTPLTVGIPGMKGARRLGVAFVFEVRDLWPELPIVMGFLTNPLLIWYARRLERKIYAAADAIIALSPGMKAGVCKFGYPPDRITVIPNGCDLDIFRPCDQPLDDSRFGAPDDLKLTFTGAHGLTNGLDAVIDAAAELKRRGERNIRFIMIGEGRDRTRLIERAEREGVTDIIRWIAPMPKHELGAVLPRLDVGMMLLKNVPALYDTTSPNKFFDYIAAGLPVLNDYPGWLAELIREHNCGLVVTPDDPKAFADACVWFRDHPDERRAMGRRARQLAEQRFARDTLGEQFVRTLERVREAWRR